MSKSRTAPLKLRVVVVGGGIGGLASAFALSKAGHYVHVIEKAESFDQARPVFCLRVVQSAAGRADPPLAVLTDHPQQAAGIRIPPNLARILFRWGLGPQLVKAAIKCNRLAFRTRESRRRWRLSVVG